MRERLPRGWSSHFTKCVGKRSIKHGCKNVKEAVVCLYFIYTKNAKIIIRNNSNKCIGVTFKKEENNCHAIARYGAKHVIDLKNSLFFFQYLNS